MKSCTCCGTLSAELNGGVLCSIEDWVEQNLGAGKVVKRSQMGSSGWSTAYVYTLESGKKVFVKQGRDANMFQGEALGLQAMYGMLPLPVSCTYARASDALAHDKRVLAARVSPRKQHPN